MKAFVEEDIRKACLWQVLSGSSEREPQRAHLWWQYVLVFQQGCSGNATAQGDACSIEVCPLSSIPP